MKTIDTTIRYTLASLLALLSLSAGAWTQFDIDNSNRYKHFRELYASGPDKDFYAAAADYETFLKDNGQQEAYFKIKCNEGFYDLDHRHLLRAMKTAEELGEEVRKTGAKDFYYLPTGLIGDIYKASHNLPKATKYYQQALEEVGDRDPKFTMLKYMALGEMACLKSPQEALQWIEKSLSLATKMDNTEFVSLSLGMKAYILFLTEDGEDFYPVYDRYESLRSMDNPKFNHRYDQIVALARYAFDQDFAPAEQIALNRQLNVDRSLVLFRLYAMAGDVRKGFDAIADRFAELDSLVGSTKDADLDELAGEMELVKMKQEAADSKKFANRLVWALIALTGLYVFVYIMGRRRLMLKIWSKNKALKEALDKAEEADRMKTAFIRNMSHEIRTPLNAINGFSQVLCMNDYDMDDMERMDLQRRISESVNTVTTIVGELLDLSQGESEHEKKDVRVKKLCQEAIVTANTKNTKGLDIVLDTKLADDFTIKSNEQNIKRILDQLLDNALKFTDAGLITLHAEKADKHLLLTVTDTGIGVPAKDREQVFENFVKLDEYKGGVGLGLSISRRLARAMGGDITIDGDYTLGTRFVVSLPVK